MLHPAGCQEAIHGRSSPASVAALEHPYSEELAQTGAEPHTSTIDKSSGRTQSQGEFKERRVEIF